MSSLASCRCRVGGQSICSVGLVLCTAARFRCNTFTVYLYCIFELFTIEGREECQASGPCDLYISDTLFCVYKERSLRDNFCGLSLRDTDFCL